MVLFSVSGLAQGEPLTDLSDKQRLQRAKNQFEYGDCPAVLKSLAGLTEPGRLDAVADILEAHRLSALCAFDQGNEERAEQELSRILFLKPDYEMDPFITPPPLMEAFQKRQKEMQQQSEELQRAREQTSGKEKIIVVEKVITQRRVPFTTNFVPFGYGQHQNGDSAMKVAAFAITEVGLLVTNVASYWSKQNYLVAGTNALVSSEADQQQYELLQNFQIGSAVLFLGVYLTGVVDSIWNWKLIHSEESEKPQAPKKPKKN
ncbi:MAG: hypothetical protein CMH56_15345 [Myxococcales bacterium]|nr:hypothetical protein [Myxococcales bacterium]